MGRHTCIYSHTCTRTNKHSHARIHTCTCANTYTYIKYINAFTDTHYAHIRTQALTDTGSRTNTQINIQQLIIIYRTVHISIYTCFHKCACARTLYKCIHINCSHTHAHTKKFIHTNIYIYTLAYVRVYVVCVRVYVCVCVASVCVFVTVVTYVLCMSGGCAY